MTANNRRDRSYSASRSVRFRLENGRTPHRDCGEGRVQEALELDIAHDLADARVRWGGGPRGTRRRGRGSRCPRVPGAVVTAVTQHEEPCPDARACRGQQVLHTRAPCAGGNRGIMRNSNVSSGHSLAPMCAAPPHRTWEPNRHTRRSPEKRVIPTKTSPHPAKFPLSHVQHQRQPCPPGASCLCVTGPPSTVWVASLTSSSSRCPTPRITNPPSAISTLPQMQRASGDLPPPGVLADIAPDVLTHHNLGAEYDRSRAGTGPISRRNTTELDAELDRSRAGDGPISTRNSTDLEPEMDRSRRGTRPNSRNT